MAVGIVILAAGKGKRMQSATPKVLHQIAGMSLIERVVATASALNPAVIAVVHNSDKEQMQKQLQNFSLSWVYQQQQLGTGDAVKQALPVMKKVKQVLVLFGDVPLITATTLQELIKATPSTAMGILTVEKNDPTGLGRIIRDAKNNVVAIVEEKDATEQQKQITEVNSGIFLLPIDKLSSWLSKLQPNNNQAEYYLTDVVAMAAFSKVQIKTITVAEEQEVAGVNSRQQLIALERYYQQRLANQYLDNGVTIIDPMRFDVRGETTIGKDTIVDINVIFEGKNSIGANCIIEANSIIRNSIIADSVHVKPNSIIDGAIIANDVIVGPFARIRPETNVASGSCIGNFVEIKKSNIGENTKINHLSYVGDADIGKDVNIGAGTITCNYDGVNKNKTTIGNDVFVGSGTQLVAPVEIEDGAFIGAGSTITRKAPASKLTLSRAKQQTVDKWNPPEKTGSE